jgi:hypothetical protein
MKNTVIMLALALACGQVQALDQLDDASLSTQDIPVPARKARAMQTSLESATQQQTVPELLNKEIPVNGNLQLEPTPPPLSIEQTWN